MMTDDELSTILIDAYADRTLPVALDQVERRAWRRTRNGRITAVAAVFLTIAVSLGVVVAVRHRPEPDLRPLRFQEACQAAYAHEVQATGRTGHVPATLTGPLIELNAGGSTLRLYTSDATADLRAVSFDCLRLGDGSVSGRLAFGYPPGTSVDYPVLAFRSSLPDGSVAVMGTLADPAAKVTLDPAGGGVQLSVKNGHLLLWGPPAALDAATVMIGGVPVLSKDSGFVPTATFQSDQYEQSCRRSLASTGTQASQVLEAEHDGAVAKVYAGPEFFAACLWSMPADDPAGGRSYNGAVVWFVRTDQRVRREQDYGVYLTSGHGASSNLDSNSGPGLLVGRMLPGTEKVEVADGHGVLVPAQLGDGAYLCWVEPGAPVKIVMTTATTVYTWVGTTMTKKAR